GRGAAQSKWGGGVRGSGARRTPAFELFETHENAGAAALVDAGAEHGERERTGGQRRQAGNTRGAAAGVGLAELRARGVAAGLLWHARADRAPGRKRKRGREWMARVEAGLRVARAQVAPMRGDRARHLAGGAGGSGRGADRDVRGALLHVEAAPLAGRRNGPGRSGG